MAYNPTIVAASLNDKDLTDGINKLVQHVKEKTEEMSGYMTTAVEKMKKELATLGNVNVTMGSTSDGGSSRRTKQQQEEVVAVEKTTQAYKAQKVSFDQMAQAQQVAIRSSSTNFRNADTLQTMRINLDLMYEKLREARQQFSSFVALASHAATTGDKGLFQFATEGVHRYEAEVKNLIPQIRTLQDSIKQMGDVIAPQGHTIQNYINSLNKANPELARMNELFKTGRWQFKEQAEAVNQSAEAQQRASEKAKNAKKGLEELNAAVEENRRRVTNSASAYTQMGTEAMSVLQRLKTEIGVKLAEDTQKPISGVNELTRAISQLNSAYYGLPVSERENAFARSLKEALDYAIKLRAALVGYNSMLSGYSPLQKQQFGVDLQMGSYTHLSGVLSNLKKQYKELGAEERKSAQGDELVVKILKISRAVQKIQQQMSRPISLDSVLGADRKSGLSEKTLDDIAYKMQQLRAYKQGIDLTKPNAAKEIKDVDDALNRLQKDADKWMGKTKEMINNNNALGRSWNYMKNRLAFYFTVGASTQFVKNLIDIRSQYEMNERALGILINSAERGTQIFNELSQMALVSPYTLIELSAATKQLTAYDVAARDVVDTTRRLADMASAVGIPIDRLTYALGQIKAYGYLNSRDARMFANAGIPLVKQLAEYYTELEGKMVSTADVYSRMKKKAIGYNDVMQVINKMTDEGGKFFDFQAKMADTLKVRLANLTLAWNNMLNDIGKQQQGILTWSIGAMRDLFANWNKIDNAFKNLAWTGGIILAFRTLNFLLARAGVSLFGLVKPMNAAQVAGAGLARRMTTLGTAFKTLAKSSLTWISLLTFAIVDIVNAIGSWDEAQKNLNKSISDGAADNHKNINQFLEQYNELRKSLYETREKVVGQIINPNTLKKANVYQNEDVGINIDKGEATKAWEAIREQIELTSKNADTYVSRLLAIENMSERVRKAFNLLEEISVVNAALEEISENTIKIQENRAAWWNAYVLPKGLIENLKELISSGDKIIQEYGSVGEALDIGSSHAELVVGDYVRANDNLKKSIESTTQSIIDFINLKGWSGDTTKIEEVFSSIINKIATENGLNAQSVLNLRLYAAEAENKALEKALQQRIEDENRALAAERDENERASIESRKRTYQAELKMLKDNTAESRVYWNDFLSWLNREHKSEVQSMFRNMDVEQIKSLDFSKGKYFEWVKQLTEKYEKEHNLKFGFVFQTLKNYVTNANQMSIRIPLIISSEEKKGIYEQLTEADSTIDAAYQKIQRLNKEKTRLEKQGAASSAENTEIYKRYHETLDAITAAEKDYERAQKEGGESKKENAAASKQQKQAESELQKALKEEITILDKTRSTYKALRKDGVDSTTALETATNGFDKTLAHVNKVLEKHGITKLDLTKYVGVSNPKPVMDMLQAQLNKLVKSGVVKPEEIKDLEVKLQDLRVEAVTFDHKTITDSLNNELGKLKDEYELAVSLDANPELGNIFADMMGINPETLPHTVGEYSKQVTALMNKYLGDKNTGVQLPTIEITNDDLRAFEQMVKEEKLSEEAYNLIAAAVEDVRGKRKKEIEEAISGYDKLIKKYGEYEAKIKEIQNTANNERAALVKQFGTEEQKSLSVRLNTEIQAATDANEKARLEQELRGLVKDVSRSNAAIIPLAASIDNKEAEDTARQAFEEFQKSPEWMAATGNLENLSNRFIRTLINNITEYKKAAKNLSPKDVQRINKALNNLYKQQRKNSPFHAIADAITEAKERASDFEAKIKETEKKIANIQEQAYETQGELPEETKKRYKDLIDILDDLNKKKKEAETLDASQWVGAINSTVAATREAVGVFDDLAKAIGGIEKSDLDRIFGVLEKAGTGAQVGASFGGYGAIIGAVVGAATGIITEFSDKWSGNKGITDSIEGSERAVRRLELAFVDLEDAMDKAYGTAIIGAKRAVAANKELQLEELERQLALEKSRKGKNYNDDRVVELKKQIAELRYEISNMITDITNDLLGSEVGSFAENLVSSMITAFKSGEDYMQSFEDKFDEMIDNMIMKSIVSRVAAQYLDKLWADVENRINSRTESESAAYAKAQERATKVSGMSDYDIRMAIGTEQDRLYMGMPIGVTQQEVDAYRKAASDELEAAKARLDAASEFADSDIDWVLSQISEITPELAEKLKSMISKYYTFGEDSEKQLSALQQGIQGITEDTAGAIEAYMNIVAQRMFEHGNILTQIRDVLAGFSLDAQLATTSQMLLQLQQSYAVQQSIESILAGTLNPSGQAFMVELK